MRGHDAVAVGRVSGSWRAGSSAEADVVVGHLLVGEVAVGAVAGLVARPETERVDAVLPIAARGVARRAEAPVAVARVDEAVLALGAHVERVVASPRVRRPGCLVDEDVGHELLEHRAAPAGDDAHAAVGVGALVDVDAEVGRGSRPTGCISCQIQSHGRRGRCARSRSSAVAVDLAGDDAEVGRDPGLGHRRVVVVGREPHGVAADVRAPVDAARTVVVEREEATVHQATGSHLVRGVAVVVVERVPAHPAEDLASPTGRRRGRSCATTSSAAPSQPLSTLEAKG